MIFKAWQKTSLIEFPGKLSTVLFTGGCNFRCPFCYNASLVLAPAAIPDLSGDTVLAYLRDHRRLYQAAVITGGEPTLQGELPAFLESLKSLGFLTGLETNGSRPGLLGSLLTEGLVDFVAADVKGPLEARSYCKAAAPTEDASQVVEAVLDSLDLLGAAAGPLVEVRCTVVPGLHSPADLRRLAKQLTERGLPRLVLQQFRPQEALEPALRDREPYSGESLAKQQRRLERLGLECTLRGV